MKKNVTYVDYAKLAAIVADRGLTELPQAGFVKVSGPKGRQVYIAKTKRVGRIDVSGFEMPEGTAGVTNLGGESFGNVHQQLDFTKPAEEILATFRKTLVALAGLPAAAPAAAKVLPMAEVEIETMVET